ncbi:MAG: hypothetical protein J7623_08530 [Chitinophaga sp.]|uniref:hypothetical protein n=1 Tax=Chitinophaga sp. TaxID=1869181 RepID=UPI001B054138|nr:hypothetical protein [Chitinophaga sp.]MBO9728668.1 hypothetical protein [Chitinophaga sp.]
MSTRTVLLVFFFIACALTGYTQQKINEKIYSAYLSDTIYYTVYTPAGWDGEQKSAVMYSFNYGMVTGELIAAQADYFSRANYTYPATIVVNIQAEMDRIGFTYRTAQLTATGKQFVNCLKNEILPAVEKKYNTGFRSYVGHSYAASYANYLFLHEWGIFNGYILLAPEKVDEAPSFFSIPDKAKDFYNHNTTFYYVAVGAGDMTRRQDYAREIALKVKALDSSRFFFQRDSIPMADHSNIVMLGLPFAFEHLYQLYNPNTDAGHTQDVTEELQSFCQRTIAAYQIPPGKTFPYYNHFIQLAISNNDTTGLLKVTNFFLNDKMKGWNIMQLGMYCYRLGLKDQSKNYIMQAITKIREQEMDTELGPPNLAACYSFLANNLLQGDKKEAWEYLKKSRELSVLRTTNGHKNIDIYYDMGVFAADNDYNVKEGLSCLKQFVTLAKDVSEDGHWLAYRKTDYYIGKCYLLLNDKVNARIYLEKALKINPGHVAAKALMQEL